MKSIKKVIALIAVIITAFSAVGLVACKDNPAATKPSYIVMLDSDKPFTLQVGDTVDYKQYFIVLDNNGDRVTVTDAMLDTSKADTSKEGQFTVTLTAGGVKQDVTFTVQKSSGPSVTPTPTPSPVGLSAVLAQYSDYSAWNFATKVTVTGSDIDLEESYEYYGYNVKYIFTDEDGYKYTDYLGYDAESDAYTYYYDNGDDTYDTYAEGTDDYDDNYLSMYIVELTDISDYEFTESNGKYTAKKPDDAGNAVLGNFSSFTWTSFTLGVSNGKITEIVGVTSTGYTFTYTFSKYGSVRFTLPSTGSSTPVKPIEPTGTMVKQTYDADTFDYERLQDKIIKTGEYADPAIGLPSTGTYTALVVPIKFGDTSISSEQLTNLNYAFNGTSTDTGWESVKTYYQKSSYGKLNLSFDIVGYNMGDVGYYTAKNDSSYYETHTATDPETKEEYNDGDNVLLHEVLKHYESKLDLTKYDSNDDGTIDAVYLIYSADVDYKNDDAFYWAYVTWDDSEKKYDGLDTYYYLFAGLDFMNESVKGKNTSDNYPIINGLKINASTYIHESGHLLGLDDYYDYYPNEGSDEGLGGADMMDYTVGDQNVYSKTMLGWLTPTVVNNTQTVTIKSSQERGDALLIPLNFDNSYFCEYLLIDLYSAKGLNEMHSKMDDTYLYGGAAYGVRIYHVSASIDNAYDNDYGSFTDCNNSLSNISLIKLVEADGETLFASSDGYATKDDLWQAGDKLSDVFPKYTTNAGKLLIFDITIDSVSATEATITITYSA